MTIRSNFIGDGNLEFTPTTYEARINIFGDWGLTGIFIVEEYHEADDVWEQLNSFVWTENAMMLVPVIPGRLHRVTLSGANSPDLDVVIENMYTSVRKQLI